MDWKMSQDRPKWKDGVKVVKGEDQVAVVDIGLEKYRIINSNNNFTIKKRMNWRVLW